MANRIHLTILGLLIGGVSLFAEDKPKAPAPYEIVNKLTGKITKIEPDDLKLTLDVVIYYNKTTGTKTKKTTTHTDTVKQEINWISDVKVRTLKLPPRFDSSN